MEDDPSFAFILKGSLELTRIYDVCTASDGKLGLEAYETFKPDIIVADIEMPVMTGLEMVKKIRLKDEKIPVLLATARTSPQDLIEGYHLGIDNYIRKPFLPEELNVHMQAILKRVKSSTLPIEDLKETYLLGSYLFNKKYHSLEKDGEQNQLTERESQILWMLYCSKGELVRRDDILHAFWNEANFYTSRSLDVFIRKLRRYLEKDSSLQIETIRGEGYRFCNDSE